MRVLRFHLGDNIHYGVQEDDSSQIVVIKGDPMFAAVEPSGQLANVDEVRLLSPVIPRSKVVCAAVPATGGGDVEQVDFFLKPNTSVVGPDDPIVIPSYADSVRVTVRLAAVVKTMCKDLSAAQVADMMFGWTVMTDAEAVGPGITPGTAAAHGFDTSTALGPWIAVSPDWDPDTAEAVLAVTGPSEAVESHRVLPLTVAEVIARASRLMTLLPGDVVAVPLMTEQVPVAAGEIVRSAISGIGTLPNRVLAR